jgi:hypothetical protein
MNELNDIHPFFPMVTTCIEWYEYYLMLLSTGDDLPFFQINNEKIGKTLNLI